MLYVIICEGKTDSVIINHFMTSYGFKYLKKNPNKFVFNLIGKQTVEYFKNSENGDILEIWNVDGCGNIKSSIEQIEDLIIQGGEINSLAIITDADFNLSETIETDISSYFKEGIDLKNNIWNSYDIKNSFEENKKLNILLLIIPKEQPGTLETILLDAIKNRGEEEKMLVKEVDKYIEELSNSNLSFLNKDRKKIKSKLGCTVNIIDPERTFLDIIPTFNTIQWNEYPIIESTFCELKKYNI